MFVRFSCSKERMKGGKSTVISAYKRSGNFTTGWIPSFSSYSRNRLKNASRINGFIREKIRKVYLYDTYLEGLNDIYFIFFQQNIFLNRTKV